MKIILQNQSGQLAVMAFPELPEGYTPVSYNHTADLPTEPQEAWRWVNNSIVVDQDILADINTPNSVNAAQFRVALTQLGLRDFVEQYVAIASQDIKDFWQFSQTFHRDNAMLISVAAAIGKTEADIKAVFKLAATINV